MKVSRKNLCVIGCLFTFTTMLGVTSFESVASAQTKQPAIRRFALIAGVNDGGRERVKLQYAVSDAKSVHHVLKELGGVSANDSVLLKDPDRLGLKEGFDAMRSKLSQARSEGQRLEVLFYFSGHADEYGLLIGQDRYEYRDVRNLIDELPADVRIAVVDSCASGALTRAKGGKRRAPFLVDSSGEVSGYAILTSSSADEAAQESDRVGGSFFTHYLISGLRGAADASRDGRVTLNEAYHYAFHETLSRTEATQSGPQHPNYDFQLVGSGDLVLTDIRGTDSQLLLDASLVGRLFIRDANNKLVAEINKAPGHKMILALEPGEYSVVLIRPEEVREGTIEINKGEGYLLATNQLEMKEKEQAVARGDAPKEPEEDAIVERPFRVALVPRLTTDGDTKGKVKNRVSLNFVGHGNYLEGLEASAIGAIRTDHVKGLQAAGVFNIAGDKMEGLQAAGVFNLTKGSFKGLQASGTGNVIDGSFKGLQAAGVFNIARFGGEGLQAAGVGNMNAGGTKGLQAAGVFNTAGDQSEGLQASGVANLVNGSFKGLEAAGVFNGAKAVKGAQFSGVVNVATESVTGIQAAGVVNIAGELKGLQWGLVNIADDASNGAQLGLINIARNGLFAPSVWTSDAGLVNFGIKMGAPKLHGIIGFGWHPMAEKWVSPIFGLGHRFSRGKLWIDLDAVVQSPVRNYDWDVEKEDTLSKARVSVGYRIIPQLALFAGPTWNVLVSEVSDKAGYIPAVYTKRNKKIDVHMWPGFIAGIQFTPQWGKLNP